MEQEFSEVRTRKFAQPRSAAGASLTYRTGAMDLNSKTAKRVATY